MCVCLLYSLISVHLCSDGAIVEGCTKYAVRCQSMLDRMRKVCPQLETDGVNNIWIIKPGAKSRGRGKCVCMSVCASQRIFPWLLCEWDMKTNQPVPVTVLCLGCNLADFYFPAKYCFIILQGCCWFTVKYQKHFVLVLSFKLVVRGSVCGSVSLLVKLLTFCSGVTIIWPEQYTEAYITENIQ